MELVVHPHDRTLTVTPGANLLEVLRERGVPISYSCAAGRCGTCRCRLIRGAILESGPEAKITNPNEGRFVLACMSTIIESSEIEVPEPDEIVVHPARILKATVESIEDVTHDIKRLRLYTAKPFSFSPGQYAQLQFGREHTRPYSMAGLSSDQELEFHIRLVANGRVTGYIANQLRTGDAVKLSGPLGTAYLRTKHEGPMLCVAGGTGLAPVLSIVRGALMAGMKNPIHVYLGVRSPQDIYGLRWLEELAAAHSNLHMQVTVAMGSDGTTTRSGLVTDAIAQDWDDLAGWRAYLCGAPAMVEAAALLVKQKGIEPDHVHADAFYPASN